MTTEEIEEAKKAALAAKPHIIVDSKKLKGKDYRDEIDSIIKPGEEDNLDFSDDELSQVLKMQVKKEPTDVATDEPMTSAAAQADAPASDEVPPATEEKLDSAVPEDVSLNTPVSNQAEEDEEMTKAEEADGVEAKKEEEDARLSTPPPPVDDIGETSAKPTASNEEEDGAAVDDGGDLEGSVTQEDPPNPYDSDNEVVDDEPADQEEEDQDMADAISPKEAESEASAPEPSEEASKSDERTNAVAVVNENGQNSPGGDEGSGGNSGEAAAVADGGDEQYKNIIAEEPPQMDNIFN
jgi:hypothetical protein